MPLTCEQIVALACQDAGTPGFTVQAGQIFNDLLREICQNYDLDLARKTYVFNFNTGLMPTADYPNVQPGGGPYPLPADYLRLSGGKEAIWFLLGVPYPMKACDLEEYDNMVQQAGQQAYPYIFATDMSQTPPVFLVWPPPSGNYQCMFRYFSQMPDIGSGAYGPTDTNPPDTSSVVPWFIGTQWLRTRLAGELMFLADDDRWKPVLGEDGEGGQAAQILRRYLKMKDDKEDRAQFVTLDRRQFGAKFSRLPNTKTIGW